MEEYVNQATKWLCSYHRAYCDAGKLCGLKRFPDIIPDVEEFSKIVTALKDQLKRETMAGDIIPYGTLQPSVIYNYMLKIPTRFTKESLSTDVIWNNMIEDMFKITVQYIYNMMRNEGVLTKNIAWLVSNEVSSWLSLTPQMRSFIAKVTELFSAVKHDNDAVKTLVECVCIGTDCSVEESLHE